MKNPVEKNAGWKPEEPESAGHLEELSLGRFSPFPEEIQRVRREAEARGEDPGLAEQQFREKLDKATARLRTSQKEEALRSLEESDRKRKTKK